MSARAVALGLLATGMAAQHLWVWAPPWAQPDVWNACSALMTALLLAMLAVTYSRSSEMKWVCCYLGTLYLITAGCSLLWLVAPWPVAAGQDTIDALLKMPMSIIGIFCGLVIFIRLRSTDESRPEH